MNLAETPKKSNFSFWAISNNRSGFGYIGWPSNNTMVAPAPRPVANQFHIIQPQVV